MESLEFSGSPEEETRTQRASHPEAPQKPLTRRTPSLPKAGSGQAREPQEPAPRFLQESRQTEEADGPTVKGVFDDTESSRFSRSRTPFSIYRPYDPFDSQIPSEPAEPPNPTKSRSPRTDRSPAKRREPPTPQDELFSQDNILIAPSLTTRVQPRRSLTPECDADHYEFSKKSVFSRRRLHDLSRPKKQWGVPDRRLIWGNQDTICPISRFALNSHLNKRLESLAEPKQVFYRYVPDRTQYNFGCGRPSVIWEIPSPALFAQPSKRLQKLAQPNKFKTNMQPDRRETPYGVQGFVLALYSGITPGDAGGTYVVPGMECSHLKDHLTGKYLRISDPSPRILRLSIAKALDPKYQPPRNIETKISVSTLKAIASPRIIDLAHPRKKIEGLCYEREKLEIPIRPISQAALQATASPRIISLAKAKPLHEDYLPARETYWPVSYAAINSKVSPRIQELANPNTRFPMHIVYYDPEVFKVKPNALKAHCSQRIEELAIPITRP